MFSLSFALCASFVLAATPAAEPPFDDAAAIEALAALIDTWEARVAFKCHFRRRLMSCRSLEDALEGRGGQLADKVFPDGAEGWFYKLGRKARYGVDYHAPPRELGNLAGSNLPFPTEARAVTNVSFDEVTDGRLEARFEPKRGNYGDAAWITVRPEKRKATACAGVRSSAWISPLTPLNSDVPNLLRLYPPGNGEPVSPDVATIRDLNDGRIEVSLHKIFSSPAGVRQTRRVVIWTEPPLPVVERVHDTIELPDGKTLEHHLRLDDFRPCGGGMVARRVRHIVPSKLRDGEPTYMVVEWRSDDLGDVAPVEEDFVLTLGEATSVIGLAESARLREPRRLDLEKIRLADVDHSSDEVPPRFPDTPE
jgi:hypothetical protein